MTAMKNAALLGVWAVALMAAAPVPDEARAQEPMDQRMRMQMRMPVPMPMQEDVDTVRIRVRFNILVPLGKASGESLARAEAQGRAAIYRMAEGECAVLESTIAATCRMSGIRIRSSARGRREVPSSFLNVTGNARYAVTLKGS
ncbi:MAG: hypothetical protein OEO83_01630 [Alphaproteobacteria bacterium]|nr:hypothetical protein [Alphaproteobacteria bacterium]